jgi:glucokinase
MENRYFAGIDIGGTKIAVGLASSAGRLAGRVKSSTPKHSSPTKIVRLIRDMLVGLLHDCDLDKRDLSGIGIGIPGLVDSAKGRIIHTVNMNLSGAELRKPLEKTYKVKVTLGNDVNLGILGEQWLGAARKARNVAGLFIGTGIGGGVIVNNGLLTGAHGAASELGHMIIQADGPKCSCGNSGCLEALASRWAMERDIRQAITKGRKTIVTKLLERKSDTIKSKILRKALQKDDPLVTEILTAAARCLGIACISLRHIYDPEIIVLGGGVIEACGDFMLPIIRKTAQRDRLFEGVDDCGICSSQLGDDAVILGGVALAKGVRSQSRLNSK